ncbi:MAG: hypothetical protein K0S33_2995 [Bacteroidetes bacterium]|jgi:hypothetical protein|nr:hypothetical protein [Bacteroidota bacterium]
MKTKLLPLSFLFVFILAGVFSCKKADPLKQLEVVSGTKSPSIPFSVTSKTILASTTSTINNMYVINNQIYLVGNFSSLGSGSSRCIVRYDGNTITNLSNNLSSGSNIYSAGYFNNRLMIGGVFTTLVSGTTRYLGYLSGSTVTGITGVTGTVSQLEDHQGDCYFGGSVNSVNSNATSCGYYSSSYTLYSHAPLYSVSPAVNAIQSFDGRLFLGGNLGNSGEKNSVFYNGSNWTMAGGGFNSIVYDMEVFNGKLYAGGNMSTSAAGSPLNRVNSLSGYNATWQKVGSNNPPAICRSLKAHNGVLIAACNNGNDGYLSCYDPAEDLWVNCLSTGVSVYRLDRILSFGGMLYGIERNTSTGMSNFVRFN